MRSTQLTYLSCSDLFPPLNVNKKEAGGRTQCAGFTKPLTTLIWTAEYVSERVNPVSSEDCWISVVPSVFLQKFTTATVDRAQQCIKAAGRQAAISLHGSASAASTCPKAFITRGWSERWALGCLTPLPSTSNGEITQPRDRPFDHTSVET